MIIRLVVIPAILLIATVALLSTMGIQNAFATIQDCFKANNVGTRLVNYFVNNLSDELSDNGIYVPQFNSLEDVDSYLKANWGSHGGDIQFAISTDLTHSGITGNQGVSVDNCIRTTYGG
jgi:hypothetical protein